MGEALAEAHGAQFPLRHLERIAATGKLQRHGDIFERGHVGNEVEGLEHDADIGPTESGRLIFAHPADGLARDLHSSVIDMLQPGQNHQQRGLARTGRTDDSDRLSLRYMKGDALQHMHQRSGVTKGQVNVLKFDNRANNLFRHAVFILYESLEPNSASQI